MDASMLAIGLVKDITAQHSPNNEMKFNYA